MRNGRFSSSFSLAVVFSVFALAALAAFCGAARAADDGLKRVSEHVWAYTDTTGSSKDNAFGANAGIIVGRDSIAVVDTLINAKTAARFLADIRAVSDKPIKYVIATHNHIDHAFGACVFAKQGAIVVAQEKARAAMLESAEATLNNSAAYGFAPGDMEGTTVAYPEIAYGDRMTLDLGGLDVELIHALPSHTGGDTIVFVPADRAAFTGDVLFTGYHPFMGEGDVGEWVKELDELKAMAADKFIPGHGPLSSVKDIEDMRQYIKTFDRLAKEIAASGGGLSDEEIVQKLADSLPARKEGRWLILPSYKMKYAAK